MSLYTLHNHYCRAFELITGHGYSPELWCQLMGQLKLAELTEDVEPRVSRSRPMVSPARSPAPETRLQSSGSDDSTSGVVTGTATAADTSDVEILVNDITALLAQGFSDQEVLDLLGLVPKAIPAIAHLRDRNIDGLIAQK